MSQQFADEDSVGRRKPTQQRFAQSRELFAQPPAGEFSQDIGVVGTIDECLEHRTSRNA